MLCDPDTADRINSYALVSYIPGRLGDFITKLRQDLVAGCVAQSHVSILPPRPLQVHPQVAADEIRAGIAGFSSFELDLPRIRVFEQTSVVFCEIGRGRDELLEMHEAMNKGGLAFREPFEYHPHITLAQGVSPDELPEVYERAVKTWKRSAPPARVIIESVTFVQNTADNIWIDLEDCELRGLAALPIR
jgi:2'-5' RNA ligase